MGPAFSTPYQDRIRAARTNERSAGRSSTATQQQGTAAERSEALKKFLAMGPTSPQQHANTVNSSQPNLPSFTPQNLFSGATQAHPRQAHFTSPANHDNGQPQDILQMEADLRRILKLDSGPSLGQSPTITDARNPQ